MGELDQAAPWWIRSEAKLAELKAALAEHAPRLRLHVEIDRIFAVGILDLHFEDALVDTWTIEVHWNRDDASVPPKVWEIGNVIEATEDNHINPTDKSCCVGVYDEWLIQTNDQTFAGYIAGPIRNFFVSQTVFRRTGEWPMGQRAHGLKGMVEAYAELVGNPLLDIEGVGRTLTFLSIDNPKGHWNCPCGTSKRFRECCRGRLSSLSNITPARAAKLLENLKALAAIDKTVGRDICFDYHKH